MSSSIRSSFQTAVPLGTRAKNQIADPSFAKQDYGILAERNYFKSSHGISLTDGDSPVVKHTATRAVTNGQDLIRNAEDKFYKFCCDNLQSVSVSQQAKYLNSSCTFFFVKRSQRIVQIVQSKP